MLNVIKINMSQLRKLYPQILISLSFLPLIAYAQTGPASLEGLLNNIKVTLNIIVIPLLLVIATVVFIYAIVMFIAKSGDEASQEKMKGLMLYSVIGFAVILSVWALANLLATYIGTSDIPRGPKQQ